MPKKKKKASLQKETAGNSRLDVNRDAYRPFENIDTVVPTKLAEKQPVAPKPRVERKEPIVLGYDPQANFGDILTAWEQTGELGGVTKRMKSHSSVKVQKSFADILSAWDNEKSAEKEKKVEQEIKKSKSYVPTKDFGSLLDQYEKKPVKKKPSSPASEKMNRIHRTALTPSREMEDALMEKEQLDEERETASVSWSFAETYRQWNELSDEESAIQKARKEKMEKKSNDLSISALRAMEPQASLDLHGMKVLEAEKACADFLRSAKQEHLTKVAIITGKGLHNDKGYSLLKEAALSQIRLSNVVREAYTPKAIHGGSGVIWVILKRP